MKQLAAIPTLVFFSLFPYGSFAQTINAVSNGASFTPNNVSPGVIASIFGTNLSSATTSATTAPLPKTLASTTVTINGVAAPLFYVSPTQINFQLPYETATGQATAVVIAASGNSPAFNFTVSAASPGIFSFNTNRAVVQNQDFSINTASNPVSAGNFITAYLTGIGPNDNAVPTGTLNPGSPLSRATQQFSATIGGVNASVSFLGLTPGFVGLAQVNIQVPTLQSGSYPLVITVGGAASNGPIITVSGGSGGSQLTQLGSVTIQGGGRNIVVNGSTAYVCGGQAIGVVDASNPSAPNLIANIGQGDLNGSGIGCAQLGNSLVEVVNTQKVVVYNIAKPTQPQLLTSFTPNFPFAGYLFFSGNIGFFTTDWFDYSVGSNAIFGQHGELYAYDFSNPAQPGSVGNLQPVSGQPASSNLSPRFAGVAVNSQTAYIASTTSTGGDPSGGMARVEIVDISNPASMKALGEVDIPQATVATAIGIQGNLALVVGNTKSWRNPGVPNFDFTGLLTITALDITNPRSPTVISTQVTNIQTSFDIGYIAYGIGNGRFALAIAPPADNTNGGPAGNGQLAFVDASNPANLVVTPLTSVPALGNIAVSGNYIYAATGTGMTIYQIR